MKIEVICDVADPLGGKDNAEKYGLYLAHDVDLSSGDEKKLKRVQQNSKEISGNSWHNSLHFKQNIPVKNSPKETLWFYSRSYFSCMFFSVLCRIKYKILILMADDDFYADIDGS